MDSKNIIEEGIRQFAEAGLKFKMDDIAESLHISKKTIYVYFKSKEELLIAMLDSFFAEIQDTKRKILEKDLELTEKLRYVMIAMPEDYSRIELRHLKELHEMYPAVEAHLVRHLEADWEPVVALMREGMESGVLRKFNIPIMQMMFTASIEQFLSRSEREAGVPYSEALKEMMDIIMEGVINHENQN
ncbi:MAG: TetR/AcrR family transcriptional regulator; helix-turn-helix transcriptional regulator [Solobacterium sp.]|nr:TetR/AcrR family transcriptional regulator; helix-turn-helix transcriptional regulator [Solobacterium sp.]